MMGVTNQCIGPVTVCLLAFVCAVFDDECCCRLIYSSLRYKHVIPLLRQLQWLKVPRQIDVKLAVFAYTCLHGLTPARLFSGLQMKNSEAC